MERIWGCRRKPGALLWDGPHTLASIRPINSRAMGHFMNLAEPLNGQKQNASSTRRSLEFRPRRQADVSTRVDRLHPGSSADWPCEPRIWCVRATKSPVLRVEDCDEEISNGAATP